MDQIEGGTLVVNSGASEKRRNSGDVDEDERDLHTVEGLAEGWKLAEANLDQLIKATFKPANASTSAQQAAADESLTVPVTTCPVFMRIQPCLAPLPFKPAAATIEDGEVDGEGQNMALFFLLILRDPTHKLVHSSLSQSMPSSWLQIPFEDNEWVEDVMVDIIRRSVECIGQEYISHRMRAQVSQAHLYPLVM